MAQQTTLHAGCVLLGETGVLIRGASGSGKSSLARALVEQTLHEGCFAAIVADDRTVLSLCGGRIVAHPHPRIAGLMEVRGVGIVPHSAEDAAVLRLVVDLVPSAPERIPADNQPSAVILGVTLACFSLSSAASPGENAELVRLWRQSETSF